MESSFCVIKINSCFVALAEEIKKLLKISISEIASVAIYYQYGLLFALRIRRGFSCLNGGHDTKFVTS